MNLIFSNFCGTPGKVVRKLKRFGKGVYGDNHVLRYDLLFRTRFQDCFCRPKMDRANLPLAKIMVGIGDHTRAFKTGT